MVESAAGAAPLTTSVDRRAGEVAGERALARREARVVERLEKIVSATLDALSEVGCDITLEEVVRRAGVTRRGVHALFDSFDDLLLAAFEEVAQGRLERQREVFLIHEGDPVAQLRENLHVRWTWFDGEPMPRSLARAVLYPTLRPRMTLDHRQSRWLASAMLTPTVEALRAANVLRTPRLANDDLVELINQFVKARLIDRVLAVPPDVSTLPADPDGFTSTWQVVREVVLDDSAAAQD